MYHILEEKYYPSFIQSEVYYKYIKLTEEEREDADTEIKCKDNSIVNYSV